MKTLATILLAAILSAAITTQNGNAKTEKIQGVDVFINSSPIQDYEVIDNGKVLATLTGSCNELVNQSAKKAAKANAQGVIIDLAASKWEAIKYK